MKLRAFYTLAALLLSLRCIPATPAQEAYPPWLVIKNHSSDTDKVLSRVMAGLDAIPDAIKQPVWNSGYKVVITPTLTYGESSHRQQWGARSRWDISGADQAGGVFFPAQHAITIPERAGTPSLVLQDGAYTEEIARHEFGHAYDCYLDYPSQSTSFKQAYKYDRSNLSNTRLREFEYYAMQTRDTGRTELFAQLFYILCSKDSDVSQVDRDLYAHFPNCVKVILALNPNLHAHNFQPLEQNPTADDAPWPAAESHDEAKRALELIASRRYNEAIQSLNEALTAMPTLGILYNYRGYCNLMLGNCGQAVADYEYCIELDPNDSNARQCLQYAERAQMQRRR